MPLLCLKKEIKLMTAGGAIVNVTSTSGITPLPYTATYGCAKAGIESLTKSLALELVPRNIRVNAVAPGITMTPRWKERAEAAGTEAIYEEASTQIPLRRFATPEEVANGIVWLASDEASYVVGHTLVIDGGFLLGNI
jgi:NAD(P)-dependent dehydrogenase (short-subunit alcohol dehydrogenase family)